VRFSIITPSYRSSEWLKLCIASVADQGVEVEHIVQDAGSDDGTLDWLAGDSRVKAFVEKDRGMYDAINRGLERASGEILAYLNCDEQYLPGALRVVDDYFQKHPDVEVVFGDVVLTDGQGGYLAHRKMLIPLLYHTWVCQLSTLSCAMFFRAGVVKNKGILFDPGWRIAGDAEWMLRLLRSGAKMAVLKEFTSAFAFTGSNLSESANATRERRELAARAPAWARWFRPGIVLHHRLRRSLSGIYSQSPFSYEVFTLGKPQRRRAVKVDRPRVGWPS
jgi:glycosyltransferase involved in cell wall biosynthesis